MNNSKIQQKIAQLATEQLEELLQVPVSIGTARFELFDKIWLNDVEIRDSKSDSLLFAENVQINFSWLPLFRGKVDFDFIRLSGLFFSFRKYKDGRTNIDFLKPLLFKGKTPNLRIRQILLENCGIDFKTEVQSSYSKFLFDPNDIQIRKLNTDISIYDLSKGRFSVEVRSLSFIEKSGFELKDLTTELELSDTVLNVFHFTFELPKSKLQINKLSASYASLDELKQLGKNVTFEIDLSPSYFSLPDLSCFSKFLSTFREELFVGGKLKGQIGNLKCSDLSIKYGQNLSFLGDFEFSGLPNLEETFIFARITELFFNPAGVQDVIASIERKPFLLPKELFHLGNCSYKGEITGFFNNIVLFGHLKTAIGAIRTDVLVSVSNHFQDLSLSGKLKAKNLQVGRIVPSETRLGNVSFNIQTNAKFGQNKPSQGNIKADISSLTFRDYSYENLRFKGEFFKKQFTGEVLFDDPNGKVDAVGFFNLDKKDPQFNFVANVSDFNPNKLNLIDSFPDMKIAFGINSNFEGGTIDNMNGFFELNDISAQNGDNFFTVNQIRLSAEQKDDYRQVLLRSDIASGYITGRFIFGSMKQSLMRIAHNYLPAVVPENYEFVGKNDFVYKLKVQRIDEISKFFDYPWIIDGAVDAYGFYDDRKEKFGFNIEIPLVKNRKGKAYFSDLTLSLNNRSGELDLNSSVSIVTRKFRTTISSEMKLENDSLQTYISWLSDKKNLFEGEFLAHTDFFLAGDSLRTGVRILPTQFMLKDSLWNIGASSIKTDFKGVGIRNFSVYKTDQFLDINGVLSKNISDTLFVDLKNIELGYVSGFIPDSSVIFGGEASGGGFATGVFSQPVFEGKVEVPEFYFNNEYWGALQGETSWNKDKKAIDIEGFVRKENKTLAKIKGGYFLSNDSLDLIGRANNLGIEFLNYYLKMISLNTTGFVSGDTHIYGKPEQITVTANAMVKQAKLGVGYLKTAYTFSDSIILKPDSILFRKINIFDASGHQGVVNGYVSHQFFKNIRYGVDISCQNMLAMNTFEKDNPFFYGQVYATGSVSIAGDEKNSEIVVEATSEPKTRVFIPMAQTSTALDNSFVSFVKKDTIQVDKNVTSSNGESSNLKLLLKLGVNPNAEVQLIIDPRSGDMLKVCGDGNLKVDYDLETGSLKLYGGYTVDKGDYLFTFQNALRKQFKIDRGSTIRWFGDPYGAIVDISAGYQLNASLSDLLDKSVLSNSNRKSVPVKCLLFLTGNLMHPNIRFDITLPNSDEEISHAVKAVINTEEMMNRQIVYLLLLNKFYDPVSGSQGDLLAVASSTLSSQLNNWASQMFKNWDFGLNFRLSGEGDTKSNEYELAFLYSPNNRLSINGNVGYRDDNLSASKFIGDVDIEYNLTQNGKLRAKAYNHTNDYREFKTALTTQGVGLVYRESFSSLKELVQEWKKEVARRKKEKEDRKKEKEKEKSLKQEEVILKEEQIDSSPKE